MATAEQIKNKTKVLVNVYEPIIDIMKHKFDAACLRRDAYLDKALRIEASFLREEVTTPNSDRAKSFITDNLRQLRLKPLNLLLSTETVELISDVCKEKNIPRDSFINRFFLLLIASESILKALYFFHKGKVEDIEKAYSDAKDSYSGSIKRYDQINILDLIEIFSDKSPISNIRELLYDCYVIPEGWEWKCFPKNLWYKRVDLPAIPGIDCNIWIASDIYGTEYEYIRQLDDPIKSGYDYPIKQVSDNGDVLLYNGYYKFIEAKYRENYYIWRRMDLSTAKKITTYNHKFEKNCFSILPSDLNFIKTDNLLGLNTYMTDDEVSKEEEFGRTVKLDKAELNKLLAFTKLEKTKNVTPKDTTPTAGEVQ